MATMDTSANKENDTEIVNKEKESTKIVEVSTVINGEKKEEEATSTSNSNNNENEEELLCQARKLMDEQKYDVASNLLSSALQIIQSKNTEKAISIESVKYYISYGESLLRFVQSSNDLFAAPVREKQQQLIAEQDEEVEVPTLITDATESEANNKQEVDEETKNNDTTVNNNNNDVDTSEDREIAWETLEYARTILEDHLKISGNENDNKYLKMLAMAHSFLGELLIEDENNKDALKEFEKAFVIHNKCKGSIECRQIAFDRFMACLAAQFCGDDECALKHCDIALNEISKRIMILLNGFECVHTSSSSSSSSSGMAMNDHECKENEYNDLIQVSQTFVDKMSEEQKEDINGKELMDLVASMQDLICKLDEVKQTIKYKKENKGNDNKNNNNNNNNVDEVVSSDPLTALIHGLTSRFGIDEQQLAELEDMNNDNDNDKNKNKNEENEGVTTIGFGNCNNDNEDNDVNELGSFGKSKSKNNTRKRTLDEAGIDVDDRMDGKKIKLNSGEAAEVENKEEK